MAEMTTGQADKDVRHESAGVVIVDEETAKNLERPKSKEELAALSAELNDDNVAHDAAKMATHTPGPIIVDTATAAKIEKPKTDDELAALSTQLNDPQPSTSTQHQDTPTQSPPLPSKAGHNEAARDDQAQEPPRHVEDEGRGGMKPCFCL